MADEILCSIQDSIATITMNRPEKRNAMNSALLNGLVSNFTALETNPDVRVIVIRGAGKAFCTGLDLRELSARQQGADAEMGVVEILQMIEGARHPTLAMVQGDALAGGCELALHCDLRVVSDLARFGMPLARLGLVIPFPLCQKLVEIVGPAFTKQILLSGQPVTAARACDMGMVHQVVPAAELEQATYDLARTIAANAPLSLSGMKTTIHRAISLRKTIDYQDLQQMAATARTSQDAKEGVRAMLEKRKPQFRGV